MRICFPVAHDFKPFNAGLWNTVYNLQDGWNGTLRREVTADGIMTGDKADEDHSRDISAFSAGITKILKVEIMHRISDYIRPYAAFGESDAGVMPDSQKDAISAFSDQGNITRWVWKPDGDVLSRLRRAGNS